MKNQLKLKKNNLIFLFVTVLFLALIPKVNSDIEFSESKALPIEINFGTKGCVCKGSSCMDQNWISFRDSCGYGNGTDAVCSIVDNGRCDNN